MKTTNTVLLIIAFCLVSIVLPINARISEVIYNQDHTRGSLTFLLADASNHWMEDWVISVPINTPIKFTINLDCQAYLSVWTEENNTNQIIFNSDDPQIITKTIISTNGQVFVWSDDPVGYPYIDVGDFAFTITFEIENDNPSYENLNISGDIIVGGKVGIGTTQPDEMLTVNGKIHAREVLIDVDFLADYVFEPEYNLMPLEKVEQFVENNKHLPGIPSAAEVKKDGLNMGEMQNKLLQKIEELTLYIIQQDKKINNLEQRLK